MLCLRDFILPTFWTIMWYVYILECNRNKWRYVGLTNDLRKRVKLKCIMLAKYILQDSTFRLNLFTTRHIIINLMLLRENNF